MFYCDRREIFFPVSQQAHIYHHQSRKKGKATAKTTKKISFGKLTMQSLTPSACVSFRSDDSQRR